MAAERPRGVAPTIAFKCPGLRWGSRRRYLFFAFDLSRPAALQPAAALASHHYAHRTSAATTEMPRTFEGGVRVEPPRGRGAAGERYSGLDWCWSATRNHEDEDARPDAAARFLWTA